MIISTWQIGNKLISKKNNINSKDELITNLLSRKRATEFNLVSHMEDSSFAYNAKTRSNSI